jgi:transcriptional regulator with XRE-family HTH domain
MKVNEIFSSNLKKYRKLKGYSQRELAKKTNLTLRMINYYENEPKSVPFNNLKKLADALNINITTLFNTNNKELNIEDMDVRWLKKLNKLKELSEFDRKELNRYINYLIERSKLKNIK